jgi:tRNA pseudouridine55 synthase
MSLDELNAEAATFVGDLMQTPPMVSAIKQGGVPLYKLARKGRTVEREPRLIHIYDFRLLKLELPRVHFRVSCTKGTYVRTLCHDIGEQLGCGAHLAELRRTRSGKFDVKDAKPLAELLQLNREQLQSLVIPILKLI